MAVTINFYDKLVEYIGDGTMDMDDDSFKLALMDSSHTFTSTNSVWADVSANDLGTTNGYTAAGKALTTPTWVESSGTITFDAADVTWTASGGSIAADDGVLYDDTPSSPADPLICSVDFDGTQTAGDTTDFVVAWNASGIFTFVATDA